MLDAGIPRQTEGFVAKKKADSAAVLLGASAHLRAP
jgi:hypothetical protein